MQKTIGMLAVLLAAQLVLAVGMSFTGPDLATQRPDTPLIDLAGQVVDRLTIDGPDKQQVVLARQGDDWVLPGTDNFPADRSRVEQLLERLNGLRRGLAVGTTGGAQQRFKVTDAAFERRIVLARNDETLATIYFGTSPGMRQVHARSGSDDAVYTTEFGIYDAPVKPGDWEDKAVLEIPQDEIASIGLGQLTLTRLPEAPAGDTAGHGEQVQTLQKTAWSSTGLAAGESVNQAAADALAQQLATLTFGSVLGQEEQPDYGLEKPVLAFSVQRSGGAVIDYRLGRRGTENDYVLKVSSRPEYFRLPPYSADALVRATGRDQLVSAAGKASDGDDATAQEPDEPAPSGATGAPDEMTSKEEAS